MTWSCEWSMPWSGCLDSEHEERGEARLYDQFQGRDPVDGTLLLGVDILLREINAAEVPIFDTKFYVAISTSQGEQLDLIGEDLQQSRLGLADEPYRCVLAVKVRALFSGGTPPDLLEVTNRLVKDDRRVRLFEVFPAAVCIVVEDLTSSELELFALILENVPAAGVGAHLLTYSTEAVHSYSDTDATPGVDSNGWFSDVDGTSGIEGAGWADVAEIRP